MAQSEAYARRNSAGRKILDEMKSANHVADSNTPTRRFFRCWLDGSYNGYEHYQRNCAFVREFYRSDKKLRGFVISQFCAYMAHDNGCTTETARRAILESMSASELERLNVELIDDARDLVRGEFEAD